MPNQKIQSGENFSLHPKKRLAIDLILAGETDAQVAAVVGKKRNTIWMWRKHDAQFIAALDERRAKLQSESIFQINNLCFETILLLERAVQTGDKELALGAIQVFKRLIYNRQANADGEYCICSLSVTKDASIN